MKTVKTLVAVFGSSLFGIVAAAACGGSSDPGVDTTAPVTTTSPTDPKPGSSGSTPSSGDASTGTTPVVTKTTIACGASTCSAPAQECCVTASTGGSSGASGSSSGGGSSGSPGVGETCVAKGKCNGDLALSCSSSASCTGGQLCCVDTNGGVGATTATCEATCPTTGGRPIQLCATDAECKAGTCKASQYGLKICSTGGTGGKDGGGGHFDGGHFDGGGSSGAGGGGAGGGGGGGAPPPPAPPPGMFGAFSEFAE